MNWKTLKIQPQWDLSEYYSSLEDKKFLQDWDFFVKSSEKFLKNYSMKNHTFHTYEELFRFYEDFEGVLWYFENLRYFLLYQNIFNPFSEKILQTIQDLEKISEKFLSGISDIYTNIYIYQTRELRQDIVNNLQKNPKSKYYYAIVKFLEDLEFYKDCDEEFFRQKYQIESELRALRSDFEIFKSHIFDDSFFPTKEEKLEKSAKFLFQFIVKRTELLSYSSARNVLEYSLFENHFTLDDADIFLDIFMGIDFYAIQNQQENHQQIPLKSFSQDRVLDFVFEVFDKNQSISQFFQKFYTKNLYITEKNSLFSQSFTTFVAGKNPKIFTNFFGNFFDVSTLIHESGHAYQMYLSKNITRLEAMPSIFMSEFCASFFERMLMDFCSKNWELSAEYDYLKQKYINKLQYFQFFQDFEEHMYGAYIQQHFTDENSFIFWLRENDFYDDYVLFTWSLYENPFYNLSYIFAYLSADSVFQKENAIEIFEKIAAQWWGDSVKNIFKKSWIDITDENFYKQWLQWIFS